MAATSVTTMSRMVDMALGSPEIGAVNFNVLHSLLHAMLQQLNLGDARAEMNADDRDFLTRRSALPPDRAQGGRDTDSGIDDLTPIPQNKSRYHQLEDKVDRIQKQMVELGALPTNAELFERVKTDHSATPPEQKSSKHHVSDMWQQMQLVKLVDTNKEGVEKSMSLIDDIMTQLQHVGELQEQLQKSQENMKKNLNMSDLWNKLKELENASSSLKDRIEMLPDAEVLENFATWSGLEDGLKGVRQEIPQPKPLHTSSSQTSPAVKETSGSSPAPTPIPEADKMDARQRSASRASRMSSPGPSQELQNLLEQLGKLTDKHSMVVQRLERLENMLKDGVGSGHDEKQLKAIQEEVDVLKKYREQDSDALHQMQQAALQMQSEVEKLGVSTQQLIDDNNSKQSHIDTLYTLSNKLDDNKADKEYIQMELGEKADRRLVDSKVNKVMFDSALDELNQLVNDILEKLTGHEKSCLTSLDELTKRPKAVTEEEWKKAMEQLSGDVDSKLDRLEFGPIRDELERQLRQLSRRLKRMDVGASGEDDAAGIRKQLLQRFHCISCDRQVDMYPHSPFPSIPQQGQMPVSKSARPYTTYELEQIRQHSRNMPQPAVDVVDVYSTMRQCGGTHTMTYPHRRITRVTTYNQAIKDDEATPLPNQKPEVDIQGADGHIYRGRFVAGFQDLSLAQNPSQPLPPRMRRSQTSKGSRMSSLTHRPSSARQGENDSHRTFTQSVPPSNNIHDSYTNATGSFSRPQSTTDVANRNGLDSGANRGGQTKSLPRSKSAASSKVRSSSEMHPKRTTSQPQSVVMAEKAKRVESPTQVPAVEVPSRPNSAANSMHEINEAWQRSQEDITSRIASQEVIDMPELVDELSPAGQASFEDFSDQNNTD